MSAIVKPFSQALSNEQTISTFVEPFSQPQLEKKEDFQAPEESRSGVDKQDKLPSTIGTKHTTIFDRLLLVKVVDDPTSYGRCFKWLVTTLAAASSALDPLSSTIFYRNVIHSYHARGLLTDGKAALPHLPSELRTTATIANLSIVMTFIGPALMPIYWSYIAERWGRRTVYIVSLSLYILFTALSASSSSISMLIATRALASTCSGTVAGAAVISDIWEVKERGFAMSIYYIGPL